LQCQYFCLYINMWFDKHICTGDNVTNTASVSTPMRFSVHFQATDIHWRITTPLQMSDAAPFETRAAIG